MSTTTHHSHPRSNRFPRLGALALLVGAAAGCDGTLDAAQFEEPSGPRRDVVLLVGDNPVVECEPLGDDCILEGDIALTPRQIAELDEVNAGGSTQESALLSSSGTWWQWPDGVVPYTIHSSLSQGIRDKVYAAIEHWHSKTSVRFVPRTNQADYVTFRYSSAGYAWAHIGRQGGQQLINLVNNPVGVIAHEMGHTLGFFHEHTRPDRDDHVIIHWGNIRPGFEGNFHKYTTGRAIGAYDPSSIMHYPSYEFSRNGYATITRRDWTAYPGNYTAISARDVEAVEQIYGGGPPSPGTGGALVIDSNNANNDVTRGYIRVSGNWVSSTNVAGYYGTGYWYAPRASVSDAAAFLFYMPEAGEKTIDAHWTAGVDRAPDAPIVVTGPNDVEIGRRYVDQRVNGGRWNTLGTWHFPKGWNHVYFSRWTGSSGTVVIADAIRVR